MTQGLLAEHWFRLAGLRPRLRPHLRVVRHHYRGRPWWVIEDRITGKHQRLDLAAWRIVHRLDGSRTLDELWALLAAELDDRTPTQHDLIRLLGQLHSADLLQLDVTPDVAELLHRRGRLQRQKWLGRVGNPLGIRIPLVDPDRPLGRLTRLARPLLGPAGLLLWAAVVLPALMLLPSHWHELTANQTERLLAAGNLLMLAVLFPLVKAVHELAHGVACKRFGGEVHEMGLMLLVLYPVPYVDASHASTFPSKWQRALVGAAGMGAEIFLAALAFYAWLLLEPGTARGVAWNVALLAGVTTLVFNANPLLRYDGYFILSDLIEVPNLAQRANEWWRHLVERHVFGVRRSATPPATTGERRWFTAYAPLAFAYRLLVSFSIALLVATQFLTIGVLLAAWTLVQAVLWPVCKGLRALAVQPQFADRGPRIAAVFGGAAVLLALGLFVVPMPQHTVASGVLWLPEQALLRAQGSGFVSTLHVRSGQAVQPGTPVVESVQPELAAKLDRQQARLAELHARHDAAWGDSPARAQQVGLEIAREQATLERLQEQAARLVLRAGAAGTLVVDRGEDLPGRWLKEGQLVGWVRTGEAPRVRVLVPQSEVDLVRSATRSVEVRTAQDAARSWPATLLRATPAAARALPSAALGERGGGPLATDPRDADGLATLESLFEFELVLPAEAPAPLLGSRVHVRFAHPPEPVGWRWGRDLRRLFLTRLGV